jgi:hypothetical protein
MLLKLVNGIMDISEVDAGTLSLKRDALTSSQIVESVIDLYGFVAEDKKISLKSVSHQSFNFTGDRTRLIQALANLLDNAIKYSRAETEITISTTMEGNLGVFSVLDQGIGIPENETEKIWDRLYRIDSSRSSRGLGLGLSLVKAIAIAHGGSVGFQRNQSIGSTFFIKIPV